MISGETHSGGLFVPTVADMTPLGILPGGKVILANSYGTDAQLYSQRNLDMQRRYLETRGYKGAPLNLAINKLHDMHRTPSDLYIEDDVHGYSATIVEVGTRKVPRATVVRVFDAVLLKEHVLEGVAPFDAISRVAAAELMLKLAGMPPIRES